MSFHISDYDQDAFRSVSSLVKGNNGFYKSEKQAGFILNRLANKIDSEREKSLSDLLGVEGKEGQYLIDISGSMRWCEYGSRSVIAWGRHYILDGFGVVSVYQLGYRGNMRDGCWVDPQKTKLIWSRESIVNQIDYLAIETKKKEEEAAIEQDRINNCNDMLEGRQTIEAEIVNLTLKSTPYGRQLKALYLMKDGNKLYGSLPSAISNASKGDIVQFTANIQPQEKGFSFFSRPTKASILVASSDS